MQPDVRIYQSFYSGPLGGAVARLVATKIDTMQTVSVVPGSATVVLGYGLPYLDYFNSLGVRAFGFFPPELGACGGPCHWPQRTGNKTAFVDPLRLPLEDSSIKRVFLPHMLEHAGHPEALLREVWRILEPGGELLVMVPNRRRVWSALDSTPFGFGRPYSRGQLSKLLAGRMFTPSRTETVLMMPPFRGRLAARMLEALERPTALMLPAFGGVLLMGASKQMYSPAQRGEKAASRRPATVVAGLRDRF